MDLFALKAIADGVLKDNYRAKMSPASALSFSTLKDLWECPRRFELTKIISSKQAAVEASANFQLAEKLKASNNPWAGKVDINLHFVYGHAVGAGVQAWFLTGDRNFAVAAMMLSWNAPLDEDIAKDGKSFWFAIVALDKFIALMRTPGMAGYKLAYINGKPAIELEFSIDTEVGYVYYGHIDVVLVDPAGNYTVLELKTSSSSNEHEAKYQNSEQALGYSIVLNKLLNINNFTVLYAMYSTSEREWTLLPFRKTAVARAEWISSIMLDCDQINRYRSAQFFPKRGQQCFKYSRICPHFQLCGMSNARFGYSSLDELPKTDRFIAAHHFKMSELIENQLGA